MNYLELHFYLAKCSPITQFREGNFLRLKDLKTGNKEEIIKYGLALSTIQREMSNSWSSQFIRFNNIYSLLKNDKDSTDFYEFIKSKFPGVENIPTIIPLHFYHGTLTFARILEIEGITKRRRKELVETIKEYPRLDTNFCITLDRKIEDALKFYQT